MARVSPYLSPLVRGLAAHALSLPIAAVLLPFLPPHACGLVAVVLAVVVVEAAWLIGKAAIERGR